MDIYFWYILLMQLHERYERERLLDKEVMDIQDEMDSLAETSEIVAVSKLPENGLTFHLAESLDAAKVFDAGFFEEAKRIAEIELNVALRDGDSRKVPSAQIKLDRNNMAYDIAKKYHGQVITPEIFEKEYNELLKNNKLYQNADLTVSQEIKAHEKFSATKYKETMAMDNSDRLLNPALAFVEKRQFPLGMESFNRLRYDAHSPHFIESMQAASMILVKNNKVMDARGRKDKVKMFGIDIEIKDQEFQNIINGFATSSKGAGAFSPESITNTDDLSLYLSKQAFLQKKLTPMHHVHASQIAKGEISGDSFTFGSHSLDEEGIMYQQFSDAGSAERQERQEQLINSKNMEIEKLQKLISISDLQGTLSSNGGIIDAALKDELIGLGKFMETRKLNKVTKILDKLSDIEHEMEENIDLEMNYRTMIDLGRGETMQEASEEVIRKKDLEDKVSGNINLILKEEARERLTKSEMFFEKYNESIPINFVFADSHRTYDMYQEAIDLGIKDITSMDAESFPDLINKLGKAYSPEAAVDSKSHKGVGYTDFVLYQAQTGDYLIVSMDPLQEKRFFKGNTKDGVGHARVDHLGNSTYPNTTEIYAREASEFVKEQSSSIKNKDVGELQYKLTATDITNYVKMSTQATLNIGHEYAPALGKPYVLESKAPNVYEEFEKIRLKTAELDDYHPHKIVTNQMLTKVEQYKATQEFNNLNKIKEILEEDGIHNKVDSQRLDILQSKMEELADSGLIVDERTFVSLPNQIANLESTIRANEEQELSDEVLNEVKEYLKGNIDDEASLDDYYRYNINYNLIKKEYTAAALATKELINEEQIRVKSLGIEGNSSEELENLQENLLELEQNIKEANLLIEGVQTKALANQVIKDNHIENLIIKEEDLKVFEKIQESIKERARGGGLEEHFGLHDVKSRFDRLPGTLTDGEKMEMQDEDKRQELIARYELAHKANEIDSIYLTGVTSDRYKTKLGTSNKGEHLSQDEVNIVEKIAQKDMSRKERLEKDYKVNGKEIVKPPITNEIKSSLAYGLMNESSTHMEHSRNIATLGIKGRNSAIFKEQNESLKVSPKFMKDYVDLADLFEGDRDAQRTGALRMLANMQSELKGMENKDNKGSEKVISNFEATMLHELVGPGAHGISDAEMEYYNSKGMPEGKGRDKPRFTKEEYENANYMNQEFDKKLQEIRNMADGHYLNINPVMDINDDLAETHELMNLFNIIENERLMALERDVELEDELDIDRIELN